MLHGFYKSGQNCGTHTNGNNYLRMGRVSVFVIYSSTVTIIVRVKLSQVPYIYQAKLDLQLIISM